MATAAKKTKTPTVSELTQQANELVGQYLDLSRQAAPLEAELKRIRTEQDTVRTVLLGNLQAYPALLAGKSSLALVGATVALRKSAPGLVFDQAKYKPDALLKLLKRHNLEGRCVELKVKASEVIKACDYVGKLPVELADIGVTVADTSYSLVVTARAPEQVTA